MLPTALVEEIARLLREGELSHRSIAAQLQISRSIVDRIARGNRGLYGRDLPTKYSPLTPTTPATRCPRCGYRVYLPCLVCRTREHVSRQRILAILAADHRRQHTRHRHSRFNCDAKRTA
ncbi:MAG: hypothetical protein U0805_14135 [Pirellulales bacterium]